MSKKKTYSKQNTSNYLLIPLIIVISVLPIITQMHQYDSNATQFTWYSASGTTIDFFLYYKSILFTIISFSIAIILLAKKFLFQSDLKSNKIFIPVLIYGGFVILSTLLSDYKYFSINGIFEHFETVFVLLGYCLIIYYGYQIVNTEKDFKTIIRYLMISIGALSLLGITQFIGHDFFKTSIGKGLIVPDKFNAYLDTIAMTFAPKVVYLTLYNPNYVGLYVSLVVPLLLVLILFSKNIKLLAVYAVLVLAMLLCLFGSGARNGMVAIPVSLLFILVLLRKKILSKPLYLIIGFLAIIGSLVIANFTTDYKITDRLKSIFEIKESLVSPLQDINTNDHNVEIIYNDSTLKISYIPDGYSCTFQFYDENNNSLNDLYDSATGIINDPRFNMFIITPALHEEKLVFGVNINGANWYFTNQEDGTYDYINPFGKYDKIIEAKTAVFTDYQAMGSSRGFIWARTIPLLKNSIIVGTGPDTFSIAYPQNDYVSKYNYGLISTVVDKPHNMYLQIGVQTGVVSLIALLCFYGIYFVWCIRIYIKNNFTSYASQIGVGIFAGSIGYMISGLFNDSNLCVSPMFWALIGIGLAANSLTQKE